MCIAVDPKNPVGVAEAPMGITVVPKITVVVAVNLKNTEGIEVDPKNTVRIADCSRPPRTPWVLH